MVVNFICGRSGCVHSDVRCLNTTMNEDPIERHKSRLSSRETDDGLTDIMGEASTEPNRCPNIRERAVRVQIWGELLDGTKPCAREALTFQSCQEM